jgi:hypothetical protein
VEHLVNNDELTRWLTDHSATIAEVRAIAEADAARAQVAVLDAWRRANPHASEDDQVVNLVALENARERLAVSEAALRDGTGNSRTYRA